MTRRVLAAGMIGFLTSTQAAVGDDLRVPQDYPTIQQAINAARRGDTVLVDQGTYLEAVNMMGKAITLRSVHGRDATTLRPAQPGLGIIRGYMEGPRTRIDGFTIAAPGPGGASAVDLFQSRLTMANCRVTECRDSYRTVRVIEGSPTFTGCEILENNYSGLYVERGSITVIDCTIADNAGSTGGGVWVNEGALFMQNSRLLRNRQGGWGGGAVYLNKSPATIVGCSFVGNESEGGVRYGGGAIAIDHTTVVIDGCEFEDNWDAMAGGAIHSAASFVTVRNSRFSGNATDGAGGAAALFYQPVTFDNCLFENNSTLYEPGGAISVWASRPVFNHCTFTGNDAPSGPAIAEFPLRNRQPSLTITNSIIRDGDSPIYWEDPGRLIDITHTNVQGGWRGDGNFDADPLFVDGPLGPHYLSQVAAGQRQDSPCVDAGSGPSGDYLAGKRSTRTDEQLDDGVVDIGYHYRPSRGEIRCEQVKGLTARCRTGREGSVLVARLRSMLPLGTPITVVLDGGERLSGATDARGRARVRFADPSAGKHEACVEGCDGRCAAAYCP